MQTQVELTKVRADVARVQSQIVDLTSTITEALAERDAKRAGSASSTTIVPTAPATPITPRIWTPASDVLTRDFSVAGVIARRSSGACGPTSPIHRSTPQPEVSHVSDGFIQGDKPC